MSTDDRIEPRDRNEVQLFQNGSSLRRPKTRVNAVRKQTIPTSILEDKDLNRAISTLPKAYNFEIHKSIHQLRQAQAKRVGLQMPEGLLMYACTISDILSTFAAAETVILGEVTYGACCVDDFTAKALGCDFLIHYGHSCLIPVSETSVKTLYVFVDIAIDLDFFLNTFRNNFAATRPYTMIGTIQFVASLQLAKEKLQEYEIIIPQARPLSPGEVLGCTSPLAPRTDATVIYIGDGRFHLESMMIHNPQASFYRYDPYSKRLTREYFEFDQMIRQRKGAIERARQGKRWALVLGTLGRQGSPRIMQTIEERLSERKLDTVKVLMSEIFPKRLETFPDIDVWVQIACPRLSIDWGLSFHAPCLTPYEALVALSQDTAFDEHYYPMDFYGANDPQLEKRKLVEKGRRVDIGPGDRKWSVKWYRKQRQMRESGS